MKKKNYIRQFCFDNKKYFKYLITAAKSQLKAEVANSYLNWIWWILQPVCFMILYAIIFGVVFNAAEEYFPIFIFIGIAMWDFFAHVFKGSVNIMRANKSIVSKVYLPKHILILIKMGVDGFKMMISFAIIVIMMIIYQVPLSLNVFMVLPILITLFTFTFALSCFMLHFGVFVADLKNIVDIVLRMFYFFTGIFFNVLTRLPDPYGSMMTKLNPLCCFITSMRNVLLYGKMCDWLVLTEWFVISLLLLILGINTVYKNENSYVKSI